MISKRGLLKGSRLCVILDSGVLSERKMRLVARKALKGGADMLQLRDKSFDFAATLRRAKKLMALAARYGVPVMMNDRLDVAVASGCDGLHIGRGDIDISLARKFLKKGAIVGVSAKTVGQAREAKRKGADYVGMGPVFKTPIKRDQKPKGFAPLIAAQRFGIPVFAIGGINSGNAGQLARRGFKKIAVIRAVCAAKDPYRATRRLKEALNTR